MKTWKLILPASVLLFSVSACTGVRPTPYWTIHTPTFANLKPGVTTKAEVRQQIGIPLTELALPQRNEEVWEYRYLDGTTIVMLAYLYFDQNGTFKRAEHLLDPAFHGGLDGGSDK
jgi:hypothetical protein